MQSAGKMPKGKDYKNSEGTLGGGDSKSRGSERIYVQFLAKGSEGHVSTERKSYFSLSEGLKAIKNQPCP